MQRFDEAVVGAGIVGLACAYHLARHGRRVVVLERHPRAQGASVRNFGMLWPIGQTPGAMHQIALRSREHWLNILPDAGIWHEKTGSLHLAYREDEAQVLQEFIHAAPADGYEVEMWSPETILRNAPRINPENLMGAMWSPSEICVDPRAVIATLPGYLTAKFGVEFRFGVTAVGYERPAVRTSAGVIEAENLYVCSGDEMQILYPETFATLGLKLCKLQMLRTAPTGDYRLGPMLAAGLTLRHYKSFAKCPSLPALKERVARETPEFDRYGIHVMASQNGGGELTLGDSHEYGAEITPFDSEVIDRLILDYLQSFLTPPNGKEFEIASRWHGIYAKHEEKAQIIVRPEPGVTLVTGVGGAGMTMSFGVAENAVRENL